MAYKNFTFESLENEFGYKQRIKSIFPDNLPRIQPSEWLLITLERASKMPLTTEKIVSEAIVFPILIEVKTNNAERIELFSGEILEADKQKKLNGECDFIFSLAPQSRELRSPLLSVLEAKKADIESAKNQAQNAAQLIGAKVFNEKRNTSKSILYGACTNGFEWVFLTLEKENIFIDTDRYNISDLPKLLGVLDWIAKSEG